VPAHMIFYQMGYGGEFTATSMIGWIALAGIIVRNSILLVDFSIHEVQKGVPVREAVIKACKTRTRPILITALALVAGSSVILTDPIFQGMAISLASGVMVSTILTLVVIPLGTIEAKKSLYEVAAAGMPAGETLHIPQEDVEIVGAPKPGGIQGAVAMLARIGGILLMIFYVLRGIVLLLVSLIRRLYRKIAAASAPPPTRPPPGPAGGTGPAGMPPSPGALPGAGGMAIPQPAAASAQAREAPTAVPRAEPAGVRARAPAPRPRKPRVLTDEDRERILSGRERIDMLRGVAEEEAIETSVASADELAVISAPIAKPGGGAAASEVPEKPAAAKVSEKITLREAGSREARRDTGEDRARPKKPAPPKDAKQPPRPPREVPSKGAAASKAATEPESRAKKPGRKGGGRRGIRLKDKLPSNKDMGLN
ncbi:MAG: efflux RND transporter permease subunit, partial [Pseudomonadota bacterium]